MPSCSRLCSGSRVAWTPPNIIGIVLLKFLIISTESIKSFKDGPVNAVMPTQIGDPS